jgi:hypothetical protein
MRCNVVIYFILQETTEQATPFTMPYKFNFITHKFEFVIPEHASTSQPPKKTSSPDPSITHILPGTEGSSYYVCRWCRVDVKNTYFKYLKHHSSCPMLKKKRCG